MRAGNGAGNTMRVTRVTVSKSAEIRAGYAGGTHTVYKYTPARPFGSAAPVLKRWLGGLMMAVRALPVHSFRSYARARDRRLIMS